MFGSIFFEDEKKNICWHDQDENIALVFLRFVQIKQGKSNVLISEF